MPNSGRRNRKRDWTGGIIVISMRRNQTIVFGRVMRDSKRILIEKD